MYKFQNLTKFIIASLVGLLFVSCTKTDTPKTTSLYSDFSYAIPLADFTDAAEKLVALAPDGVAIGEVHGQLAGIMLLEAVVASAKKTHKSVLVLHEFVPTEINLDLSTTPSDSFDVYNPLDSTLPLWTLNNDKRATHELRQLFIKISKDNDVELSYLWDPRLNPLPNKLKAHGFAERWSIAKKARPEAYIVALAGNYHTSNSDRYDLDVTNSLCRYAEEKLNLNLICVSVDNHVSKNENCQDNQQAVLLKGEDLFLDWDYFIRRPDGCVAQAHWVNAP